MKTILLIVLSLISGRLYQMGGSYEYNTKVRDFGVPSVMLVAMWTLGLWHWTLILCFGLLFGSLTTYWKKKGSDALWYNWLITGLMYSVAMLPVVIALHLWIGFAVRTVILSLNTMLWSEVTGNDFWEEFGRGVLIVGTLPLLIVT